MDLNYKVFGTQGEPIVILHGLFGMLDNWQTLAKQLGEAYKVFVVDLPNHGKSDHTNQFDYKMMSKAMYEFMNLQGLLSAHIIGHSLGGKVAMRFAQFFPEYLLKLVVVDIAPKSYSVQHRSIIDALQSIALDTYSSRKEVEQKLSEKIDEQGVVQFLVKNIYWKSKDQLGWRFNLDVIAKHIENVGASTDERIFEGQTLFIRGGLSSYILDEDFEQILNLFPKAQIKTIYDSGHWVHAEKPNEFLDITKRFLAS